MCFPFFIVLSAGLPRRLFLPHAVAEGPQLFAQSQIFAVAVDDEFGLVEAELTVLVQQALVHVAGDYFGEEEVVAAQRDDLRDPAFQIDRAFFQNGAVGQHAARGGVQLTEEGMAAVCALLL